MSEWFQRQFGDRAEFAISFSLGVEPHRTGIPERDLSWGALEIWARDRCLTASVSAGAVSQGIRWCMLPILEWLLDVGVRLVNEDPYPRFSKGRDVRDGSQWYDATLSPPALSPEDEQRWFLRRSEWRNHHALRRAAEDVVLPNVVFKRSGEDLEVSWDNEAWPSARRDMYFVEKRGTVLVSALGFGEVVREALIEVTRALSERNPRPSFRALAQRASELEVVDQDWRWLIHRPTAAIIRDSMPTLCARLDAATNLALGGLYVPHTPETLVLRQVRAEHVDEINAVLDAVAHVPSAPMPKAIQELVRPRPAQSERPWDEGNDYAEQVREALGWGDGPLPDLTSWLPAHGIGVPEQDFGLPPSIAVLAERTLEKRAMVHVNPRAHSERKRETGLATALGHVLLDDVPVSIDGEWEHWPTSARARAFGVALMLPEDGVRSLLAAAGSIGVSEVRRVMKRYRSGPFATTYRLKNLGLISGDEHDSLVRHLT